MKISWQLLVFTFSTIFLVAAIVVGLETWQGNSVALSPTETPTPTPDSIEKVIAEYRGDGSIISNEYADYFHFAYCNNEISVCNHYLILKNDIESSISSKSFSTGEKIMLSGNVQGLGVAAGNHYFMITGDLEAEPLICIQVITPARNLKTGEIKEFPTPCDVPDGWSRLSPN